MCCCERARRGAVGDGDRVKKCRQTHWTFECLSSYDIFKQSIRQAFRNSISNRIQIFQPFLLHLFIPPDIYTRLIYLSQRDIKNSTQDLAFVGCLISTFIFLNVMSCHHFCSFRFILLFSIGQILFRDLHRSVWEIHIGSQRSVN